jgi:hypothetical protein
MVSAIGCRRLNLTIHERKRKDCLRRSFQIRSMRTKQLADTAAFDAALIHLSLGPDEQVGTLIVRFHKRINVTPESLTDVKDALCRDFSPRWKTANRGVNNLAGARSISKMAELAMGGVHISALHIYSKRTKSARSAAGSPRICSMERNSAMSQTKRASKGKRPSKAVSVLGIAGASLAASTAGSLADIPSQNSAPFQFITLGEEEISDVSLATFHLFDKEGLGTPQSGLIQLARGGCGCGHGCGGCGHGCGGCGHGIGGCGHGIGGCGHGFGGCRGCRGCRGCGGAWGGCGGCGWGWGLGGCCLSWGGCYIC